METTCRYSRNLGISSITSRLPKTDMWDKSAVRWLKMKGEIEMKLWKEILLWIISILIALMWAAAAFGKLKDLEDFRFQLGQSPLLQGFEEILTWVVPYGELLLAVILIYPATRLFALYTSVFLLSLFITYIAALLKFSYYVPCACSGFADGLSWKGHVVFNIVFMVLAIIAIFIHESKKDGFTVKQSQSKILYNRAKANP